MAAEMLRVLVLGGTGLVGSAVLRALKRKKNVIVSAPTHKEVDLLDQRQTHQFFADHSFDQVFVAAAKVGGILYNKKFQADFLYENMVIAANVIHSAHVTEVKKLLYLGSSCIYPRLAEQPIQESSLLSGALEPTNEGYALAKIAGLKLCEKYNQQYGRQFISAMPTNLYGPGDNFHPEYSHVIPGMMRRFHQAKVNQESEVVIWGSGQPRREFLFVEDLADALIFLMDNYSQESTINVGCGEDVTIANLAEMMKEVTGFQGALTFDTSKPDGTPRKLLDVSRLSDLGWRARTPLKSGLSATYQWACEQKILL